MAFPSYFVGNGDNGGWTAMQRLKIGPFTVVIWISLHSPAVAQFWFSDPKNIEDVIKSVVSGKDSSIEKRGVTYFVAQKIDAVFSGTELFSRPAMDIAAVGRKTKDLKNKPDYQISWTVNTVLVDKFGNERLDRFYSLSFSGKDLERFSYRNIYFYQMLNAARIDFISPAVEKALTEYCKKEAKYVDEFCKGAVLRLR